MEIASKAIGGKGINIFMLNILGKKSEEHVQACCDRLAGDAERRKEALRRKKEQQLLKQEQECQDFFKPKINQKYHINREHVMSAGSLLTHKNDYKDRMERF